MVRSTGTRIRCAARFVRASRGSRARHHHARTGCPAPRRGRLICGSGFSRDALVTAPLKSIAAEAAPADYRGIALLRDGELVRIHPRRESLAMGRERRRIEGDRYDLLLRAKLDQRRADMV